MKKRIASFCNKFCGSSLLHNILCLVTILLPTILAIGVTIDYLHGKIYPDIPLWFAWMLGIISSFGILAIWSIGWDFLDNK